MANLYQKLGNFLNFLTKTKKGGGLLLQMQEYFSRFQNLNKLFIRTVVTLKQVTETKLKDIDRFGPYA